MRAAKDSAVTKSFKRRLRRKQRAESERTGSKNKNKRKFQFTSEFIGELRQQKIQDFSYKHGVEINNEASMPEEQNANEAQTSQSKNNRLSPRKDSRPKGSAKNISIPKGMNMTRKELRKEMRKDKKARKNAWYNKRPIESLTLKLENKHNHDVRQYMKKYGAQMKQEFKDEKKRAKRACQKEEKIEEQQKKFEEGLKRKEKRILAAIDTKEVKKYEKLLKLDKRKNKSVLPKAMIADGLDYILDVLDPEKLKAMGSGADDVWRQGYSDAEDDDSDDMSSNSSDEDMSDMCVSSTEGDLSPVDESDGSYDEASEDSESSMEEEADTEEDEAEEDDDGISAYIPVHKRKGYMEEEEQAQEQESENDCNDEEAEVVKETSSHSKKKSESTVREDIYGRKVDSEGRVITESNYVPPARRAQLDVNDKVARKRELERLRKMLKGQLNRVSENNMHSICKNIEGMYRENSRADMGETLRDLVCESSLSDELTPPRLSMEMAMLVALLHNNISTDIGATFLEMLANDFHNLHSKDVNADSKKIDNIITFLCHLYNFKVTQSTLLLDVLHALVESFKDKDVELILIILRNIALALRKDDPAKIKDILLSIQKKANEADMSMFVDQSRVKFMLNILTAIKHNNMTKIPNYDPSHIEHLRKTLSTYIKGGKLSEGQLNISLKDLLNAQSKGKWWVVGSAWQGNSLEPVKEATQDVPVGEIPQFSKDLLTLARKQRMNTDTRRTIFCTIMSSEDYVDAYERLIKLGLKGKNEEEIIIVIVECCCNEKTYNPFYTYLLKRFLSLDRRFMFHFQCCLWDKFKVMKMLNEAANKNLASMAGMMIKETLLSLTVLKNVEFGQLTNPMVKFIRNLLLNIFELKENAISDIFYKIGMQSKLKHLKDGLSLFMQHFMLRSASEKNQSTIKSKVDAAEKGLSLLESSSLRL